MSRHNIMGKLGLTPADFEPKPVEQTVKELRQRNAELTERLEQTKADMESMRAEFRTRLAEVITKSGIEFDKGSLNNPYEWKPLLLVVTGLYYEHDGVVKRCIDGGIAKDFEARFEAV